MKSNVFEKVLNNVSLDPRISDGVINLEAEAHMDALREYFTKRGVDETMVIEFTNKVMEGKYPERQAYNAKGILVTFPTPEYKQKAIQKGTHFEKNPAKQTPNVFGGKPSTDQADSTPTTVPSEKPTQPATQEQPPTTKLSKSGTPTDAPPPQAQPSQPQAAPKEPSSEPTKEPNEPPPTPPKSAAEKGAERDVIKKMLKGDDYMLERVLDLAMKHMSPMLHEEILKRI